MKTQEIIQEPSASTHVSKHVMFACMIGNALEWYDFVIYGYFAALFGALFFPTSDEFVQLLASLGVFWTGFLARPLGSIVFGHLADRMSRKFALTLSIYMMAIPTALMGCLPTYSQVGIASTIALIFLRAFQGFALGGEFTGTMVFLVEHSPQNKRGFWGSFASFSAVVGVIMGSALVTSLNLILTANEMQTWGWRIPFILSIVGSIVGMYMRARLVDPKIFLDIKNQIKEHNIPLKDLFLQHKSKMGLIILLDFLNAVGFFIVVVFLSTYFRTHLGFPDDHILLINTFNMIVFGLFILLGGWISDYIGRKKIIAYCCLSFIVLSYPLFLFLQDGDIHTITLIQAIFAIMMGLFFGVIPATLAEIMPTKVRCSGLSLAHNLSMAIFGGGAPFMATHLITHTDDLASPAYLLIISGLLSLSSLLFIKERYRTALE